VKRLPLTVIVRAVDQRDPLVDLTGHQLHLLSINDTVFLRANAVNNGTVRYCTSLHFRQSRDAACYIPNSAQTSTGAFSRR